MHNFIVCFLGFDCAAAVFASHRFEDGLTRLCTEKYEEPNNRNLTNMCMHLTNYAINKGNDNFVFNKNADEDGVGSKRSLVWFRNWLTENGHDSKMVFRRIGHMVNKTLISVQVGAPIAHPLRVCLSGCVSCLCTDPRAPCSHPHAVGSSARTGPHVQVVLAL